MMMYVHLFASVYSLTQSYGRACTRMHIICIFINIILWMCWLEMQWNQRFLMQLMKMPLQHLYIYRSDPEDPSHLHKENMSFLFLMCFKGASN